MMTLLEIAKHLNQVAYRLEDDTACDEEQIQALREAREFLLTMVDDLK